MAIFQNRIKSNNHNIYFGYYRNDVTKSSKSKRTNFLTFHYLDTMTVNKTQNSGLFRFELIKSTLSVLIDKYHLSS